MLNLSSDLGIARFARFYLIRSQVSWGVRPSQAFMIHPIKSVLLLAVVCTGCDQRAFRSTRADVYAIYGAALDSFATAGDKTRAISSQTWAYSPARQFGDTSSHYRSLQSDTAVGKALVTSFDSANAVRLSICGDCFPPDQHVELSTVPMKQDTPGPLALSNVAFSRDGTRALVAVGYSCGALCGHWELYLVRRRGDHWRVERTLLSGSS
jgi:hypothetical protein